MTGPRQPTSPTVTFDLQNSRNMLEKLRWEYEQLSAADLNRAGKVNTAINCAWTAWHLHEWVWAGLKDRHELKARYAKAAGVAPQKFRKEDFGEWLARTNADLAICQVMTTSAKHVGFQGGDFTTVASGNAVIGKTIDDVPDFDSILHVDALTYMQWELKIVMGDKREPAVDLFQRVIHFWTAMIYGERIDDSSIGEQPPAG